MLIHGERVCSSVLMGWKMGLIGSVFVLKVRALLLFMIWDTELSMWTGVLEDDTCMC